jgi:hypothetical protein
MSEEVDSFLESGAELPDGEIYPFLSDPDWVEVFRRLVHESFQAGRDLLVSLQIPSADHVFNVARSGALLASLKEFLLKSAQNSTPEAYPRFVGPLSVLDAYKTICGMYAEAARRLRTSCLVIPIRTLAYADALLIGEDTAKATREAEELIVQREATRKRAEHGTKTDIWLSAKKAQAYIWTNHKFIIRFDAMRYHRKRDKFRSQDGGKDCSYEVEIVSFENWALAWHAKNTRHSLPRR